MAASEILRPLNVSESLVFEYYSNSILLAYLTYNYLYLITYYSYLFLIHLLDISDIVKQGQLVFNSQAFFHLLQSATIGRTSQQSWVVCFPCFLMFHSVDSGYWIPDPQQQQHHHLDPCYRPTPGLWSWSRNLCIRYDGC